jgi:hypothetical protein
MPEPAGVTFDRDAWLALADALADHPLVAKLEAQRLAAEFSAEERAAYEASREGFGWLVGSDAIGWYPRHPGRHTRAGPDGESIIVDPPRRSLGTDRHGRPIEAIVTDPVPSTGVHGLLRRGIIRELEPMGDGVFGALASLNPAPFPWRAAPAEDGTPLTGAWLLDAEGQRIAWVPDATDAHTIVRDGQAARAAEADSYRIGALRDSLSRLYQVTHPDDRYQPPPELARLHGEAREAVDRLLAALPDWAGAAAPPAPADDAARTAPLPAGDAGGAPPAAPRRRSAWPLTLGIGILLGWLLRG